MPGSDLKNISLMLDIMSTLKKEYIFYSSYGKNKTSFSIFYELGKLDIVHLFPF